ncbi:hypothetical protein GAY33_01990 [Azospirillum brasilense]|uniref:Uracil DNA glycosylase superfamily protein n=1 Tax=Azospirillum argentinense TaxID=2970906 RepID=A0A5B0KT22_9PROT|nr:hypothetical protein [Azospirillum argentinense]KAA1055071.1 hypothetical protein FH063_005633 [Azospirillum argentinense]MBK3798024.1 hypothetical protein [Azospirillum argentinense]
MAVSSIDASATDNDAELRHLSVILGDVPPVDARPDAVSLFRTRVAEHGERVRALRDSVSPLFVVNGDLTAYSADGGPLPELILVGDNPGRREFEQSVYLCVQGRAGAMAHSFFDGIFGAASFRSKVMVLNKSSFHTPRTVGLTEAMRGDPALAEAIRRDQEENALLIADSVALLGVPVVTIGMESGGTTFQSFRKTLETRYRALGNPPAIFQGKRLASPFRKVPHFSLSKIFCRNADPAWNAGLDGFLARHAAVPGLRTENGNVSSKLLLGLGDAPLLADYLDRVILGNGG